MTNAGKCMVEALSKIQRRGIAVPPHHPELSFINKTDLELEDWQFDGLTDQGRKALVILRRSAKRISD